MKTNTLAIISLILTGGLVRAEVFFNPPESNYPNPPGWQTTFPYQRNIYWDFSVDPSGGPSAAGTPGAVYEGQLDPALRASDTVTFSGGAAWYSTFPYTTRTGLVGLNNTGGTGALSGEIIFHLDNINATNPRKHVYVELDQKGSGGAWMDMSVNTTSGPAYHLAQIVTPLADGAYRLDLSFQLVPNPAGEDIVFTFGAVAGGWYWADNFHVATECVPEPGITAFVFLSTIGLIVCFVRRKEA